MNMIDKTGNDGEQKDDDIANNKAIHAVMDRAGVVCDAYA